MMTLSAAEPIPTVHDRALSRRLKQVAEAAARSVEKPLMAAFRSAMEVDEKVDFHDIVTVHDKATEAQLIAFILDAEPDSAILGEEGGATGTGSIQWYLDPIDGTANFASGLAFWCVSIAAAIDGEVVAGVVFDPVTGNMFSADAHGAYLNGNLIAARSAAREADATLITGYPVARDFRLDGRAQALEDFAKLVDSFRSLRRPGSAALSICHVAAGWVDAAAGFGVNAWDVAAAMLILRRAGGEYRPLTLGKVPRGTSDIYCPGYVALGAGANYPTLLRVAEGISARRNARAGIG